MSSEKNHPSFKAYTKEKSAAEHIDTAIALFEDKKFAAAITLSLAAEDSLPEKKEIHLLSKTKALAKERGLSEKELVDALNHTRNWLKHDKLARRIRIDLDEVIIALLRGITKYYSVYISITPKMGAFIRWYKNLSA